MLHYLNLPGAAIVLTLMVALSLYLATTFTFHTAREWVEAHSPLCGDSRAMQAGGRTRAGQGREAWPGAERWNGP